MLRTDYTNISVVRHDSKAAHLWLTGTLALYRVIGEGMNGGLIGFVASIIATVHSTTDALSNLSGHQIVMSFDHLDAKTRD